MSSPGGDPPGPDDEGVDEVFVEKTEDPNWDEIAALTPDFVQSELAKPFDEATKDIPPAFRVGGISLTVEDLFDSIRSYHVPADPAPNVPLLIQLFQVTQLLLEYTTAKSLDSKEEIAELQQVIRQKDAAAVALSRIADGATRMERERDATVKRAEQERRDLQDEIDRVAKERDQLSTKLQALQDEIFAHRQSTAGNVGEQRKLLGELTQTKSELSRAYNEIRMMEQACRDAPVLLREHQERIERLTQELAEAQQRGGSLKETQAEVVRLNEEAEELRAQLLRAQQEAGPRPATLTRRPVVPPPPLIQGSLTFGSWRGVRAGGLPWRRDAEEKNRLMSEQLQKQLQEFLEQSAEKDRLLAVATTEVTRLQDELAAIKQERERRGQGEVADLKRRLREQGAASAMMQTTLEHVAEEIEQHRGTIEETRLEVRKQVERELQELTVRRAEAEELQKQTAEQLERAREEVQVLTEAARQRDEEAMHLKKRMSEYEQGPSAPPRHCHRHHLVDPHPGGSSTAHPGAPPAGLYGLPEAIDEVKQLRVAIATRDKQIFDLVHDINARNEELQALMEENDVLRKDQAKPYRREEVKLRARLELEQLRSLVTQYEDDIAKLEAARAEMQRQLRVHSLVLGQKAVEMDIPAEVLRQIESYLVALRANPDDPPQLQLPRRNAMSTEEEEALRKEVGRAHEERDTALAQLNAEREVAKTTSAQHHRDIEALGQLIGTLRGDLAQYTARPPRAPESPDRPKGAASSEALEAQAALMSTQFGSLQEQLLSLLRKQEEQGRAQEQLASERAAAEVSPSCSCPPAAGGRLPLSASIPDVPLGSRWRREQKLRQEVTQAAQALEEARAQRDAAREEADRLRSLQPGEEVPEGLSPDQLRQRLYMTLASLAASREELSAARAELTVWKANHADLCAHLNRNALHSVAPSPAPTPALSTASTTVSTGAAGAGAASDTDEAASQGAAAGTVVRVVNNISEETLARLSPPSRAWVQHPSRAWVAIPTVPVLPSLPPTTTGIVEQECKRQQSGSADAQRLISQVTLAKANEALSQSKLEACEAFAAIMKQERDVARHEQLASEDFLKQRLPAAEARLALAEGRAAVLSARLAHACPLHLLQSTARMLSETRRQLAATLADHTGAAMERAKTTEALARVGQLETENATLQKRLEIASSSPMTGNKR
ncbi:hypothetical protein PAPYR_1347 [Paratrimastix pyriformis]|uniref:Centrosomal protein of 70 kDa n=1 Tax=Paratrimastix pyriformis TaxID=342808 RepID=A0ABQ8UZD8_9EUKA|nr:hypothetical protein PAPYR_1347 [Paratrimastix pyriformis]